MTYKVKVVQVFRVEREIYMDVEAEDQESAEEKVTNGDLPCFDDPRWRAEWELQNEEIQVL